MGKPKKIEPPPAPEPAPTIETTEQAGDAAVTQQRKRRGFQKTLLTGALTPTTGKKTVLG